jgi:D-lactate dehydrogenase
MKTAVFSTKPYDRKSLTAANAEAQHELRFFEPRLTERTVTLASGFQAVCPFINDELDEATILALQQTGVRLITLRSAGFNNVDLRAAAAAGITVLRVPAYSPYAVAEHALALIMTLNRKTHRAYNRVREGNFALEGLLGFDINGRTVGVIGTGKIGMLLGKALVGMGCELLGHDPFRNEAFLAAGGKYVELNELLERSDIISLHCPLTPESHHLISADTIARMKPGVMLINTSRGGLIDTRAVIKGLKSQKVGYLGLDVYEDEEDLFYENLSDTIIQDDVFQRLMTFPNVLITSHQAFFTEEAIQNIADTTIANLTDFEQGRPSPNEVVVKKKA